jgi:hypothetical protein
VSQRKETEATEAMPMVPRHRAKPTDGTEVLPAGAAFGIHGSDGSKTKAEGRKPLDFSKNTKIGRFEMIREIARGGMGQVFLARDTMLGRKVAIKFLLHDDPDFVQRFLVEARATARCTHENIVTIYEVGEHEGLPYMVLEYLEGKTLSEVLESHPSLRHFTEIMTSVTRALERAHEHGIVHRDLKPSNIFVTDRGQVKVLDFGVARMIDRAGVVHDKLDAGVDLRKLTSDGREVSVTQTSNSLVGTLPYMSPEQWGTDAVDHMSDLWSVGIMFWRALTGAHPAGTFAPDKLKAVLCDLETPLPSIGSKDSRIPRELVEIIDRCLEKPKARRYQNATELLHDLQHFLAPRSERAAGEVCPYRGLAAFGEDDAKYFFGRSNEIRTALAQLETWPLLAVIGPSGVGKSSFVHAGLVPAVRAAGGTWQVRVLRPGRVPLHRLASVLEETLATGEQHSDDVMEKLVEAPGLFGTMLRSAAARRNHRVLVVVDQLEELFTLCDSDRVRKAFLAALLAAADDPSSPVRVVLSMRADFLDRLAGHKQFLAELSRGLFFLTAPDQDNLRETLVRPAELAGYTFETDEIIEDMMQAGATSRGALPLLSFAATRLWDARDRQRKMLTVAAYNQMGGVGGAFARHADQVAASVPAGQQILLRAVMTRLVTPDGTRAVVDHKELLSLSSDTGAVEQILDQLVRARLVHLHTDPDQGATVEIVHEMLISEWPTLRRWLEEGQAVRGFLHELGQAAKQWEARGRSKDLVWRGAPAVDAINTANRNVLDLSATEADYLLAVRKQAARSRRRRVFAFVTIFGALGAVIAGGAVAIVRITAAEQQAEANASEAQEQRTAADMARKSAEAATKKVQAQLDEVQRAEAAERAADLAKQKAEEEQQQAAVAVEHADAKVKMSAEELQRANTELKRALSEATGAKKAAEANAAAAKKATEEAKKANEVTKRLLQEKEARVKQLEDEKKHIYDGDLLHGSGK